MITLGNGNVLLRATAFAGALLFAASAGAGQIAVRIMAQESIPPKWIDNRGVPQGFCPDLLAAIERIEPRLRFIGFERPRSLPVIEDALDRGTSWAACGVMESELRRRIAIRSTVPLFEIRHRLAAVASDTQVVENFDDLLRLHPLINTARGSAYIGQLKARGLQVDDSTGDNVVNLRKTVHGHGRYTYMSEFTLKYLIRVEHLQDKLRILPAVFNEDYVYFWTSKKANPAVAPMIDQALAQLKASGELARIYERWARIK